MSIPNNTYNKLNDGSWGVRGEGPKPAPGTTLYVTTKAGKIKTEEVVEIVWEGKNAWVCTIKPKYPDRRQPFVCEECGYTVLPGSRCWETGNRH